MSPGLRAIAEAALVHGWCEETITADMGREILAGESGAALREAATRALIPLAALDLDAQLTEDTGGLQMLAPSVRVQVAEAVEALRGALSQERPT